MNGPVYLGSNIPAEMIEKTGMVSRNALSGALVYFLLQGDSR